MLFVLTYDVSRDHTIIKQTCLRAGFIDCARMDDGSRLKLPNTTLLGDFDSAATAMTRFMELARSASQIAVIEKVFVTQCSAFRVSSNENC